MAKKTDSLANAKAFIILSLCVLFGFFIGANQDKFRQLTRQTRVTVPAISAKKLAQEIKNKNFTLINVHTPYEGEIMQTDLVIPYTDIVASSALLPQDKTSRIILYCKSGHMSEEAVATLTKLGYTNVSHLGGGMDAWKKSGAPLLDLSRLDTEVLPAAGVEIPVTWGNLGPRLVNSGVIDLVKFKETVKPTREQEALLLSESQEKIRLNPANSQFILDVLWALGLAQKSLVYTEGPMGKEYAKDVGNFSSTGGWTLSRGLAVTHLGQHELIPLTPAQQAKVSEIAKNIYRPCCGNSTYFPDCNHGMAMLALLELLVANGVAESDIYRFALSFNSYWFGQTYVTTATYFARQGIPWKDVDARLVLGANYSSGKGAAEIAKKVGPLPNQPASGGGCGA